MFDAVDDYFGQRNRAFMTAELPRKNPQKTNGIAQHGSGFLLCAEPLTNAGSVTIADRAFAIALSDRDGAWMSR
jgi:hypothetical protein